ncbi:MAG: methionine--tRNA ligase [Acidobacteria bacterium]|nr:methionine--tRNA ligase [Acidobacteriota bacterium]MCB9396945.1 methionine--tRNA ligase [Acidobacteriota bacterium]
MRKLITSALPYVNNVPHLGNIIGCVLSADVYARFCRARGYETLYICGTDEYGTATENKAREEGLSPQEICDKYHAIHAEIYRHFEISFDAFGRTSHPEQTEIAQQIFKDVDANGLILEETTQRTYCEHDAIFLADRYVEGTCPNCGYEDARGDQCDRCKELLDPEKLINPRCKICGNVPVLKATAHLNLDLASLQPELQAWFEQASKQGQWTRNAVQTTQAWLDRGLAPRPITRDLKWGIPVPKPGFENKVFYVWFDAPIGYISITARAFPNWREWWQNPESVQLYQFMAKDNIPFHTVMFPASLLATRHQWTLLHHINSTEYLNYEDSKFSKSRNIGVFGTDVVKTGIHPDLWRFYLLFNRPEKNDTNFVWSEFFTKVNSDLLDNIGNLVHRTLVYLKKNFDGQMMDSWPEPHQKQAEAWREQLGIITQAFENVSIREALRLILLLGNEGNKFFQDMAPWEQIKADPKLAQATVSLLTYLVRALARVLEPFMPSTAHRIFSMLNLEISDWDSVATFSGLDGHQIGTPEILYPKLDLAQAEKWRKRFGGEWVDLDRACIRVGRIESVQAHPHADQLYVLQVDLGTAQKRVVAGLVHKFSPEQLLQRKVLVVCNLAPADLRGVISEGMVLVAESRKSTDLFNLTDFAVGSLVSGCNPEAETLAFADFQQIQLKVSDGQLRHDDEPLLIDGLAIRTESLPNGKVR